MELFAERGYDDTTVADIAERAGLTKRTFFRHFADKREVLFGGGAILQDAMTAAIAGAPADATPIEAVALALTAGADLVGGDLGHTRARQAIITAHPELQERELIKMARIGARARRRAGGPRHRRRRPRRSPPRRGWRRSGSASSAGRRSRRRAGASRSSRR